MAIYNAGNAYLQILPSFRGIERLMQRETAKLARSIDKSMAQGVNDELAKAFDNIDTDRISRGASKTGDKWANAFERQVTQQLKDLESSLPRFAPKADLDQFDQALKDARQQIGELSKTKLSPGGGGGGLDDLGRKLDDLTERMTRLSDQATDADKKVQLQNVARQAQAIRGMVDNAQQQGGADGRKYGGAFAEEAKKTLTATLRDLPEINVGADTSAAERRVAKLREDLVALGDKKIGVDIDEKEFARQVDLIAKRLESLARNPQTVGLKFDLDAALEDLRGFNAKVGDILGESQDAAGRKAGASYGGAYADEVENRIRRAAAALPDVPIKIDDSEAQKRLTAIRLKLQDLGDKKVGIDIDAATAQAQIEALRLELERLDGKDVSIDVRTNAARAAAELAVLSTETDHSSASFMDLAQNATISMSRLGYLVTLGASLGSLIGPAAATAALGIAGIGVAASSALAGVGTLVLGLYGIPDAVKKIGKYEQDADASSKSFAQAQKQVADATDSLQDAERNLGYARKDAADAAAQAQQRIADAERNVAKVQRDTAEAVRRARENEKEAITSLARARRDAADSIASAVQNEQEAERSSTEAVKAQRQARLDLADAIKQATIDLKNLQTEVKRNQLDIDEATTAAMKAKEDLDKIMTNPRATEIERRQALEAYQDKVIQIEELKNKQQELATQQAAADKQGVESTDRVKRAREAVASADQRAADAARRVASAQKAVDKARLDAAQRIGDAEKRVSDAREATIKAQSDGAERVAEAQRQVTDAQKAAAKQQEQSQRQIQSATEAVTKAQRGLTQASINAGVAGGDAFDNMRDALNNLSPAGRNFALWLYSLKPKLDELRRSAQEGLLPGLQDGLKTLVTNYFPEFDRFVGKISAGLGNMFRATSQILLTPQWREFFTFLEDSALPNLQGMWVTSLNLARGIANVVRALAPLSAPIGQGLIDLSERFARWSDTLQSNSGFKAFAAYVVRVGPQVVNLIEQLAYFIGRVVVAAAPIGEVVLRAVTAVVEWMNSWDIGTLTKVIDVITVVGTGILLLTGFLRIIKFVTETWTAVTKLAAGAQDLVTGAVARYQAATVAATDSTGLLNGAMFRAESAGKAGAVGMAAMDAAAGPLGLALLAISLAWFAVESSQKKANEATDELGGALEELGKAYQQAANSAELGSAKVEESFRKIVAQNKDMQQAVITLSNLGVGLDDIAGAAGGSAAELDRVLGAINARLKVLNQQKIAAQQQNETSRMALNDISIYNTQIDTLSAVRDKFQEAATAAHVTSDAMAILNQQTADANTAAALLTPTEQALADAQTALADSSTTAQQKLDALTKVQDVMRQSTTDAIEADEAFNSSLLSLQQSVQSAKDQHDKHATSLALDTAQGLRNRDALEAMITSADKMYDSDVALNGVTVDAVKKGNDHYNQIRRVAAQLGLNKTQTENLIAAYGKIPRNVETAIGFKAGQFDKMFEQLEMTAFIQKALRNGQDIDQARQDYKNMISDRNRAKAHGWATGGPIDGPGIVGGPTEDANLILASKGEFMQPVAAVNYYGTGLMEAIRTRAIPREILPGFASGGAIGGTQKWPFTVDLSKYWVPSDQWLIDSVGDAYGGAAGTGAGPGGWRWQEAVLRAAFGNRVTFTSTTGGGHATNSWHYRGRAVDSIGPDMMAIFRWIMSHYGGTSKELIYSPAVTGIKNGQKVNIRSYYGDSVYKGHFNHVHWAYDDGGMLPPGYSTVFNGTGSPEPVLNPQQWRTLSDLAGVNASGPGITYNFEFRDTTLDPGKLRALQQREAVMARYGRPR